MKTTKALVLVTILLTANRCSILFPNEDDFLTIPKTLYTGNELRLDGFYYDKWEHGTKYSDVTFFYNNGVALQRGGSGDLSDLEEYAEQSVFLDSRIKDIKGFWGLFLIENNKIIYEKWVGTQLGYLVYREEGEILNDTTFFMTEQSRMNQGIKTEVETIDRTYCFKAFSPKPDSTNTCIP